MSWTGWGWLAFPLIFLGVMLGVAPGILLDSSLASEIGIIPGSVLSVYLLRRVGERLNRDEDERHTLYGVPVERCWIFVLPFPIIGLMFLLFRLTPYY